MRSWDSVGAAVDGLVGSVVVDELAAAMGTMYALGEACVGDSPVVSLGVCMYGTVPSLEVACRGVAVASIDCVGVVLAVGSFISTADDF